MLLLLGKARKGISLSSPLFPLGNDKTGHKTSSVVLLSQWSTFENKTIARGRRTVLSSSLVAWGRRSHMSPSTAASTAISELEMS
jgi:hypothetical protein